MLHGRSVLLIIGGGIAAYKAAELIRLIRKAGGGVRTILTKAGAEFVTPLTLAGLSGEKVYSDLFSLTDETEMGHIELSRSADLIVVAPATADLMAKAAHGLANDLASTTLLATDKPVLMAPAMNVRMWNHAATQRNLSTLREDGVSFVGPDEGDMACGEYGPGRLAEPAAIMDAIKAHFARGNGTQPLAGRHVLITAGPTHEPIDPVRYIANRSSGKQGYGPVTLPAPAGVTVIRVETAEEMDTAVENALPADLAIFAAAVADWRVKNAASEKIKKQGKGVPPLELAENPDILARVSRHATKRPALVVGFAAETENVIVHATAKLARKGCDLIIANDVSPGSGVIGGEINCVHILSASGAESLAEMSKSAVAEVLVARFAALLGKASS
jgi:phosphopantothenoylcysteine decarboxylase/phosphopantothenate--cysteine ligase